MAAQVTTIAHEDEIPFDEVMQLIRDEVKASSQRATAKRLGVTDVYLGDVLRGKRTPTNRILEAYGIVREVAAVAVTTYRYRRLKAS